MDTPPFLRYYLSDKPLSSSGRRAIASTPYTSVFSGSSIQKVNREHLENALAFVAFVEEILGQKYDWSYDRIAMQRISPLHANSHPRSVDQRRTYSKRTWDDQTKPICERLGAFIFMMNPQSAKKTIQTDQFRKLYTIPGEKTPGTIIHGFMKRHDGSFRKGSLYRNWMSLIDPRNVITDEHRKPEILQTYICAFIWWLYKNDITVREIQGYLARI